MLGVCLFNLKNEIYLFRLKATSESKEIDNLSLKITKN